MRRFINTMVYGVTAVTLTVLATTTAFADGKGGHSAGHTGNSNGSSVQHTNFKPANQTVTQVQHFTQNNQVKSQNTLKQTNLAQNLNHSNSSQFKKIGGPGKDFNKTMHDKKFDFCWNSGYCDKFGCYKNCWWGGWNYSCWNTYCYPYCGFDYPCFSFYPYRWRPFCYTLGYTVSPVFAVEVVVPEIVVPQLAVKGVVSPVIVTPAAKAGLAQNATMDAIETVPSVDTSFITGSSVGNN